jgi:transposase
MKAYSEDLRQRIVAAIDRGMSRAEALTTFRVSLASIKRYLKQRRETGHLTVKPRTGLRATKGSALATHVDQLLAHDRMRPWPISANAGLASLGS